MAFSYVYSANFYCAFLFYLAEYRCWGYNSEKDKVLAFLCPTTGAIRE